MNVEQDCQNCVTYPLLATRFFLPPLPFASVPRPRLNECLVQGLRGPLMLISAPPGFGKSTIVLQWLQATENLAAGWLSLEPSDQDWGQFFRYLVAAWQRIFPGAGEASLASWKDAPFVRRETLLDLLLNDLLAGQEKARDGHSLLVLDDYHRIESGEIHETITYLVEHLPPRCHLAILTRADPPLPLARWRSRGQMLELRGDDLRFTSAEALAYLNQGMRLGLTDKQVRILLERTEGWIAGLQMAALSLQGGRHVDGRDPETFVRDFDGSNRFVLDYLVDEVLRLQPEEVQQFLLSTSILDQFCGSLCDALLNTDSPRSEQMLDRLEKANLFLIPLDGRCCWFRYHHLFADLLRMRLRQNHPELILQLYRRAAEWFAGNGLWQDAVRYALQTRDMDFGIDLFEQAILKGRLDFLSSGIRPLVDALPAEIVQNRPLLSLAKAEVILQSSQLDGVEPLLRFAEEGVRSSRPFPGQEDVLGLVYLLEAEAATQLGDRTWAVEAGQQVPKWIPNDFVSNAEALIQLGHSAYYDGNLHQTEFYWQQVLDLSRANHNTYYVLSLLNAIARTNCQKGELRRSEALFLEAFELLDEHAGQYPIWLGAMQRDYSELLRDLNRLEEARIRIQAAIPLLEKWHTINALGYGFYAAAKIYMSSGDLQGTHEMLGKADDLHRQYTLYPDLEALIQLTRSRLYLEEGEIDRAWQLLDDSLHSSYCQYIFHKEWALIAQARILVRTGRPAEALSLLAGRQEDAKANGRGRNWLSFGLLTALAHNALGDRQTAFRFLEDGLMFAQARGHRRALIEEGEPLRRLLEVFRVQFPQSPFAAYIAEILPLFPVPPSAKPKASMQVDGLEELLSPREIEILKLVCQGRSNQEIAGQLVLSVGTVKFHIHNIFGKLSVRDRPQAIAKAAQLGL